MTLKGYLRYLAFLLGNLLVITQLAYSQTANGTIAGSVLDGTGGAVSNADITAKNTVGGESRTVKTGPNGSYRFENIPPSTYDLSVSAPGFNCKDVKGLEVPASTVTSQNVSLTVGGVQQVVEVTAGTSQTHTL